MLKAFREYTAIITEVIGDRPVTFEIEQANGTRHPKAVFRHGERTFKLPLSMGRKDPRALLNFRTDLRHKLAECDDARSKR